MKRVIFSVWMVMLAPLVNAAATNRIDANAGLMRMLSLQKVAAGEVSESLNLPARVELNQQHVARIGATVSGRITEVEAMLGQVVKKGQRLAVMNSAELGKAQSDFLKASSQVNLSRLAVQRAERLLQSDVIAAAELLDRQGALLEAEVDKRSAADQLRVMGMDDADLVRLEKQRTIHSFSPITATIDGVVIERNVALGQVVQPADSLYTVADLSELWLVAEVPEQQAYWARVGDQVQAEVPALPDQAVVGKLIYIADLVNPQTRTVMVRIALDNRARVFKPQMLADLKISKPGTNSIVIPSEAVVRDNDKDHVYVKVAEQQFELRPVRLGREHNHQRPVLSGLTVGETVVVGGAFHLNNERLRSVLE